MNQRRFAILLTICLAVGSSVFGLNPATTESVRMLFSELMTIDSSPSLEAVRPRIEVRPLQSSGVVHPGLVKGAVDSEDVGYKRLGSPVEQGPISFSKDKCYGVTTSCLRDTGVVS